MATKREATNLLAYEEFEPFCKWKREENRETLIVDLPDFKKEQLRVHINNRGILKVSGERSVDASKRSKFYKEVVVPRNCNTSGIQAKFANHQLYIIMPKLAANVVIPEQNKPQQVAGSNISTPDLSTRPEPGKHEAAPSQELGRNREEVQPPTPKGNASRGKELTKMVVNAGMVSILLAAIVAFVVYMFKSTIVED